MATRTRRGSRPERRPRADPYPGIGDYALIGDCHSAALVSTGGSIDWCCMPRFDAGSCFGRLLDWDRGGYYQIVPTDEYEAFRHYLDDTLVLATTFETATGMARVVDFFAMVEGGALRPRRQLIRIVEGLRGVVAFTAHIEARFDYGSIPPWLRHHGRRRYTAIGGSDALVISSDVDLELVDGRDLVASFAAHATTRQRFSVEWMPPEDLDRHASTATAPAELDCRLEETLAWWRRWTDRTEIAALDPAGRRSAIVLKALTHAPTGAVVAAVTTSLPEQIGGVRNWDYRFSWIRDSQFTVRSLGEVGCEAEADGFRRFVERSAAGSADMLQVMYGVGGEHRLTELELTHLEGYRGSRPVRIGNAAAEQLQLDVYGYLLDLAWLWHERGRSPNDDYWRFLISLVDAAAAQWDKPDNGIWEVRGEPQHFVHSKVMCWVAVDRGIRLAKSCLRQAPLDRWEAVRARIARAIERRGYDAHRGVYRQAFDRDELDAALLLLPQYGFVDYRDERMVRTVDAIATDLDDHGFLKRYRSDDGLEGPEGAFLACSFWLAEALAYQGRLTEALEVFDRAASAANDVGLFAEEVDTLTGQPLGNVPQGLSHLSHLEAALAIARQSRALGLRS